MGPRSLVMVAVPSCVSTYLAVWQLSTTTTESYMAVGSGADRMLSEVLNLVTFRMLENLMYCVLRTIITFESYEVSGSTSADSQNTFFEVLNHPHFGYSEKLVRGVPHDSANSGCYYKFP